MNIFPNIHNRQLKEFHFDKNLPFIQYPEVKLSFLAYFNNLEGTVFNNLEGTALF